MVFGAIIGAAASLYGASKDRKAGRAAQKAAQEYNERMAGLGRAELTKGMAEQAGYDEKMMAYLQNASGFMDDAASMSRSIGARGRQDVAAMYQQGAGDMTQNLAARGLGGTTLSANLAGQVMGNYSRGMADFSSGIMGQQAAAQGMRAKGQGMLAQGIGQVGEHRMDSYVDMAQSYFGQTATAAPATGGRSDAYGKLGGLFGDAIGGLFGGGSDGGGALGMSGYTSPLPSMNPYSGGGGKGMYGGTPGGANPLPNTDVFM